MKVALNPVVSFKSNTNLLEQKLNEQKERQIIVIPESVKDVLNSPQYPTSWGPDPRIEQVKKDLNNEIDFIKKQGMSFEETLTDDDWEKTYYPKGDYVHIRQKGVVDGKEFEINNQGRVLEVGCWTQPKLVKEPSKETVEIFNNIKNGKNIEKIEKIEDFSSEKTTEIKPKKSLWFRMKEGIANVWKFFSVAGTMAYATGKGLWQGAVAGAGVLGAAWLLKGAKAIIKNEKTFKDVIKTPLKTAGTTGKVFAVLAGLTMLGINIVKGKLKANQNSAVIEHKMDVAHVND